MVTSPIPTVQEHRRRLFERLIWVTDLVVWVAIITIGVGITINQPIVIQRTIGDQPMLVWALSAFYLVGGVAGLTVRLLRLGLFEKPALWLASGGLGLFGGNALFAGLVHGFPATVTVAYSVAMVALLTRRVFELDALTATPGEATIISRLRSRLAWAHRPDAAR